MNPPLSTRVGYCFAASTTDLAAATGSPSTNATADGSLQEDLELRDTGVVDGPSHQGVLDHLELRAALGEGPAELGDLGHAEAAVLGEQQGVGSFDPLLQLSDPFDLLLFGHRAS